MAFACELMPRIGISIARNRRYLSQVSFHKRELPSSLIALSSKQGRGIFKEALALGGMESYFPLAEQFVTQSDPSYCSLSSLAMVLNAINYDPKRVWKNPWRWVSEEMLMCESKTMCSHSIDRIKKDGMNFNEFAELAECHGVRIDSQRASFSEENCTEYDRFRDVVMNICRSDDAKTFIIVNICRKTLGQTGSGHYSPIGGIHVEKELALILDVARFKYPPYWVPLKRVWEAMAAIDPLTGLPRGYFVVSTWSDANQKAEMDFKVEPLLAAGIPPVQLDGLPGASEVQTDPLTQGIISKTYRKEENTCCEHLLQHEFKHISNH